MQVSRTHLIPDPRNTKIIVTIIAGLSPRTSICLKKERRKEKKRKEKKRKEKKRNATTQICEMEGAVGLPSGKYTAVCVWMPSDLVREE